MKKQSTSRPKPRPKIGPRASRTQRSLIKTLYSRRYTAPQIRKAVNYEYIRSRWKGPRLKVRRIRSEIRKVRNRKDVKEEREIARRRMIKVYRATGKPLTKSRKARLAGLLLHYAWKSPVSPQRDALILQYQKKIRDEGS